jgi:hypothetical protein
MRDAGRADPVGGNHGNGAEGEWGDGVGEAIRRREGDKRST